MDQAQVKDQLTGRFGQSENLPFCRSFLIIDPSKYALPYSGLITACRCCLAPHECFNQVTVSAQNP